AKARAATPTFSDAYGIHVVSVAAIDGRQYNVRVESASALGAGRPVDVRILLPTSYDVNTTARFPVLYLLHGTSGRPPDWGGFGSTTYAARHPDTFVAAASFSGAPEIDRDPDVIVGATAVIEATALFLNQTEPDAMFGPRATNEINWQGHDPSTLMTNLRGM